jgi:integrase/recombinase XerC
MGRGRTLSEHVIAYTAERSRRGEFTKGTRRQVECVLLRFARTVGNPPPDALTSSHVEEWLASVGGLARSTVRNRLSTIRRFCVWLIERGELAANPCDGAPRVRQPRSVPRALPADAVGDLYAVLPDVRAEVIVSLMVQEGLRCLEVAGLEVGDVDLSAGVLVVAGKGGHQRMLPVSAETSLVVRRYLLEHPASAGPLVRRYDRNEGLTSHYVSDLVRGWMRESGVKQRPLDGVGAHSLRHTAATDVLRANGGNVVLVQRMLGHVSLATTQVYLRTYPEDLRRAMAGRSYRRGGGTVSSLRRVAR